MTNILAHNKTKANLTAAAFGATRKLAMCRLRFGPSSSLQRLSFKVVAAAFLVYCLVLPTHSHAQQGKIAPAAPIASVTDEIGVNHVNRMLELSQTDVVIGPQDRPMVHTLHFSGSRIVGHALTDNYIGGIAFYSYNCSGELSGLYSIALVGIGPRSECFNYTVSSGGVYTFTPRKDLGSTLVDIGGGKFRYTTRDGTKYVVDTSMKSYYYANTTNGLITSITEPNGLVTTITWEYAPDLITVYRVKDVKRNDNYGLKYYYVSNVLDAYAETNDFTKIRRIVGYNTNYAPTESGWPMATYDHVWNVSSGARSLSVTDYAGEVTRYTMDLDLRVTAIKPPHYSTDQITFEHCPIQFGSPSSYCTSGNFTLPDGVKRATAYGDTYTYSPYVPQLNHLWFTSYGPKGTMRVMSRTDRPLVGISDTIILSANYYNGTFADWNDNATNNLRSENVTTISQRSYSYGTAGRITSITADAGGESFAYSGSCPSATCIQPTTIWDRNGNITMVNYNSAGLPTRVTSPAVDGVSPQIRYTYQTSSGIWLLASESTCRTGPPHSSGIGCTVAGDEVLTSYQYTSNNLLLYSVTVSANGQSRRSCFVYNKFGDLIAQTSPKGAAACS